ncbi:MAG: DUF6089 family protein [Bacteroidota bacterium]|nr:DUF6089 family protein [Bacteroidota bacterium]
MKRLLGLSLSIFLSVLVSGQRSADYGVFGGVSSYIGDINTNRLFYSPLPAAGVFYRYNFHPRQSLRANIFFGRVRASDLDFHNPIQLARRAEFSGNIGEMALQFEFNFLPYSTQGKKWNFTPYFAAGAGLVFIDTKTTVQSPPLNFSTFTYQPIIPFSIGFKINIHKNLGLEAEYGFRKTFYDNFDGLTDNIDPDHKAWLHNNDWYSFAGIAFTWKIYNKLAGCPAFKDVDQSRRH